MLRRGNCPQIMEKESGKMEIKIVEVGENKLKMIVRGEDHTFLNLLQHYLLEDEHVLIAKYNIPHPLTGEPELVVKTNGKNPLEVIKEANEKIIKACNELLQQL